MFFIWIALLYEELRIDKISPVSSHQADTPGSPSCITGSDILGCLKTTIQQSLFITYKSLETNQKKTNYTYKAKGKILNIKWTSKPVSCMWLMNEDHSCSIANNSEKAVNVRYRLASTLGFFMLFIKISMWLKFKNEKKPPTPLPLTRSCCFLIITAPQYLSVSVSASVHPKRKASVLDSSTLKSVC